MRARSRKSRPSYVEHDKVSEEMRARWQKGQYRYPIGLFHDDEGVWEKGKWRSLNLHEREVRLRFPRNHTLAAGDKQEIRQSPMLVEDYRCALLGTAFAVPVVAVLMGQPTYSWGILAKHPSLAKCWGLLDIEERSRVAKRLGVKVSEFDSRGLMPEVVRHVQGEATHKGSEVRLAGGVLRDPREWPRRSIDASRWNGESAYPIV